MTKYMERNKILVVDDEEDLCEILQFNLESEGFAVDIANSAEEALKLLTDEHELILLDVMMEGMSGFKMAEKVRKEMHMNTPIIFLTAKDTENDMLTGFSIGGDDYIAKPFSIKEVAARVKAVLKRAGNIVLPEKKKTIEIGETITTLECIFEYKLSSFLLYRFLFQEKRVQTYLVFLKDMSGNLPDRYWPCI